MAQKRGGAVKKKIFVANIQKRDGTITLFDIEKITNAIHKAMLASGEGSLKEAGKVAENVYTEIVKITDKFKNFIPNVEGIQDSVEKELILSEYVKTAKAYILYRQERTKVRAKGLQVPPKVK